MGEFNRCWGGINKIIFTNPTYYFNFALVTGRKPFASGLPDLVVDSFTCIKG